MNSNSDDIPELTRQLKSACDKMIFSVSGWRGVFAEDGNEESRDFKISAGHRLMAGVAALVFFKQLKDAGIEKPVIIVGIDTRPSGLQIAEAVLRALSGLQCSALFAGIVAAPDVMACARKPALPPSSNAAHVQPEEPPDSSILPDGFIYISASHNPIGHNGLNLGLNDGGVLKPDDANKLIVQFKRFINDGAALEALFKKMRGSTNAAAGASPAWAITGVFDIKQLSVLRYRAWTRRVIAGDGIGEDEMQFAIREGVSRRNIAIVADFNGSARSVSIDKLIFQDYGVKFSAINERAGEIAHKIVPENEALIPCANFLAEMHKKDSAFIAGYVPDCDGDRGNLVYWDDKKNAARPLEAQEVFALCCVSELSQLYLARSGSRESAPVKAAIVVNDPTSMRVDEIAAAFGAKVFRAEVGEANVVALAEKLRLEGWTVRILGEGSAGGNITHPSKVRDPLSTIFALVKLFAISWNGMGFFEYWCKKSNYRYKPDFTLSDIIASLPVWTTTGTYEEKALLKISNADHSALKSRYQKIFIKEFEDRSAHLKETYGITGFKAFGYNGITENSSLDDWGETGRGGLKILFYGGGGALAALWMRGSATEPVFRIMADVKGDNREFEGCLINWQRLMLAAAAA